MAAGRRPATYPHEGNEAASRSVDVIEGATRLRENLSAYASHGELAPLPREIRFLRDSTAT